MHLSALLLSFILLASVFPLILADEQKEDIAIGKVEPNVRLATPKVLCRICFHGRGPGTQQLIRSKGCPLDYPLWRCKRRITPTHFVRGLRCACRKRRPTPSPSPSPSPPMQMMCDNVVESGGQGITVVEVELGQPMGIFTITYNMFGIPDALDITYGTTPTNIFSTGGLVSGSLTEDVNYGSATSTDTTITVTVTGPNSGTAWNFMVTCPA